MDYLKLCKEKLSVEEISDLITSPRCGAISLFVGTTRDNFEGKTVLKLEYEAYESMALKSMKKICEEIRNKWPTIENIVIYHRLGEVPVKEASIIIGTSSPHRADAMAATEFCINSVKESVTIWKKEVYKEPNSNATWKENKELIKKRLKFPIKQEVKMPQVPAHLIQIKASSDEINDRINKFIQRKREEINRSNIRDFCRRDPELEQEFSCARIDSVLLKRKDSVGHLKVDRVLNTYSRDQNNLDYLYKFIPKNGVDERLKNLESQLSLDKKTPTNVYERLKLLEDRLLYLESISPEYQQFWKKNVPIQSTAKRKKIFSVDEIDSIISDIEKCKK